MTFLELQPLTSALLPAVLELDQRCFGGFWTLDGYQRELESPNSEILIVKRAEDREQRSKKNRETGRHGDAQTSIQNSKFKIQNSLSCPSLLALGCYWAILEEAHITILAVDPDYQRQGLGQTLLCALLDSAHRRGLQRATLEVRISNQSALHLYEKFGFKSAGRRKRYYPDTGEDALILWRSGLQSSEFSQLLQHRRWEMRARLYQFGWRLSVDWDGSNVKTPDLTC